MLGGLWLLYEGQCIKSTVLYSINLQYCKLIWVKGKVKLIAQLKKTMLCICMQIHKSILIKPFC